MVMIWPIGLNKYLMLRLTILRMATTLAAYIALCQYKRYKMLQKWTFDTFEQLGFKQDTRIILTSIYQLLFWGFVWGIDFNLFSKKPKTSLILNRKIMIFFFWRLLSFPPGRVKVRTAQFTNINPITKTVG